jgi:hypothetical protein
MKFEHMFKHSDPNADLAVQQAIFGSRAAPAPSLKERLLTRVFGKKSAINAIDVEKSGPMGEVIRNALFSDIPELAPNFPILSNPKEDQKLPEKFVIISLIDDAPDSVQIELIAPDIIEARYELLQITTKLEKGKTTQVALEDLCLKSDRMVVHYPTLPNIQAAICRVMIGCKTLAAV